MDWVCSGRGGGDPGPEGGLGGGGGSMQVSYGSMGERGCQKGPVDVLVDTSAPAPIPGVRTGLGFGEGGMGGGVVQWAVLWVRVVSVSTAQRCCMFPSASCFQLRPTSEVRKMSSEKCDSCLFFWGGLRHMCASQVLSQTDGSVWQVKYNLEVPCGNSTSRQRRWDAHLDFGMQIW